MNNELQEMVISEYEKSRAQWRSRHFSLCVIGVVVLLAAEISMFFLMNRDATLSASAARYFWKYVTVPFVCNVAILLCGYAISKRAKSSTVKNYAVALTMVMIIWVICIVHSTFLSLFAVGILPIICSAIYCDRRLTTVVAFASVLCLLVSAFCIVYDPTAVRGEFYVYNIYLYLLILLCVYGTCLSSITWEKNKQTAIVKREQERRKFQDMALNDELTGVSNRFALRSYFSSLQDQDVEDYWFVMMDIDHFKTINDTYGHQSGDAVLHGIGHILRSHNDTSVASFRYGGDEFCLILLSMDERRAVQLCGQIQKECWEAAPCADVQNCIVSIGLARHTVGQSPSKLIRYADIALYEAKHTAKHFAVYREQEPESAKKPEPETQLI